MIEAKKTHFDETRVVINLHTTGSATDLDWLKLETDYAMLTRVGTITVVERTLALAGWDNNAGTAGNAEAKLDLDVKIDSSLDKEGMYS